LLELQSLYPLTQIGVLHHITAVICARSDNAYSVTRPLSSFIGEPMLLKLSSLGLHIGLDSGLGQRLDLLQRNGLSTFADDSTRPTPSLYPLNPQLAIGAG